MKALVLDIDGVLTDGTVAAHNDAGRRLHLRDLDALTRARDAGLRVAFLTGEAADQMRGIVARCGGGPVRYGAKDKAAGLKGLAAELGLNPADVCFIGDARRDVPALKEAGLGLVPADGDLQAKLAADYVLSTPGGRGAVADAIDLLLAAPRSERRPVSALPIIQNNAQEALAVLGRFVVDHLNDVERLAAFLADSIETGATILLFGNGGSAAMAQHFATELVGRFRRDRDPFRAVALTSDTAVLTAVANDSSFDEVFSRQVVALGNPGDVAIALSTSGSSSNVVAALATARAGGLKTVMLTGEGVHPDVAGNCDLCLQAPSSDVPRIQEIHLLMWHLVCEHIEARHSGGRG